MLNMEGMISYFNTNLTTPSCFPTAWNIIHGKTRWKAIDCGNKWNFFPACSRNLCPSVTPFTCVGVCDKPSSPPGFIFTVSFHSVLWSAASAFALQLLFNWRWVSAQDAVQCHNTPIYSYNLSHTIKLAVSIRFVFGLRLWAGGKLFFFFFFFYVGLKVKINIQRVSSSLMDT